MLLEYAENVLSACQKVDYRQGQPASTPEEALEKMGMGQCVPDEPLNATGYQPADD